MKILCKVVGQKGKQFKKMSEATKADQKKIADSVAAGWEFCDRATWKRECRDKENQK